MKDVRVALNKEIRDFCVFFEVFPDHSTTSPLPNVWKSTFQEQSSIN